MNTEFKRLLWKEYKESRLVWVAVLATGLLSVTLAAISVALSSRGFTLSGFGVNQALSLYFGMSAAYVIAITATIFTKEREKDRYVTLRRFPISCETLLEAKTFWVLVSLLSMLGAFLLIWLLNLALGVAGLDENTLPISLSFALLLLELFVWGLFWSERSSSPVKAIILTTIFGILTVPVILWFLDPILSAMGTPLSYSGSENYGWYVTPVPLLVRLLVLIAVAIPTYRRGIHWFESVDRGLEKPLKAKRRLSLRRYRPTRWIPSPFRRLTRLALARSWKLFVWATLYAIGLFLFNYFSKGSYTVNSNGFKRSIILFCNDSFKILKELGLYKFLEFINLLNMSIIASNVFARRARSEDIARIGNVGASPVPYWWSRMITHFPVYFLCSLLILASVIQNHYNFGGCYSEVKNLSPAFLHFLAIVATFFGVGAFIGLITPVRVLAILLILILTALIYPFTFVILNSSEVGSTLTLMALPILVLFLIGSYLIVKGEFYGWAKRKFRVLSVVALLALSFLWFHVVKEIVDPFFVPLKNQQVTNEPNYSSFREQFKNAGRAAPDNAGTPVRRNAENGNGSVFYMNAEDAAKNWLNVSNLPSLSYERELRIYAYCATMMHEFSIEELEEWTELLEMIPQTRFNVGADAMRFLLNFSDISKGEGFLALENTNVSYYLYSNKLFERIIDQVTERAFALGGYYDQCYYQGTSTFSYQEFQKIRSEHEISKSEAIWYRETNRSRKFSNRFYLGLESELMIPAVENQRRIVLVGLAYQRYYRENGRWPDAPEEVVEAGYLDQLPSAIGLVTGEKNRIVLSSPLEEAYSVRHSASYKEGEVWRTGPVTSRYEWKVENIDAVDADIINSCLEDYYLNNRDEKEISMCRSCKSCCYLSTPEERYKDAFKNYFDLVYWSYQTYVLNVDLSLDSVFGRSPWKLQSLDLQLKDSDVVGPSSLFPTNGDSALHFRYNYYSYTDPRFYKGEYHIEPMDNGHWTIYSDKPFLMFDFDFLPEMKEVWMKEKRFTTTLGWRMLPLITPSETPRERKDTSSLGRIRDYVEQIRQKAEEPVEESSEE